MWSLIFLLAFGAPLAKSFSNKYSNNFDDNNNFDLNTNEIDDLNNEIPYKSLDEYVPNDRIQARNLADYDQCNNKIRELINLADVYDNRFEYEPAKVLNITCSWEPKIDPFSKPPNKETELCYFAGGSCNTKYARQIVLKRDKRNRHVNCWEKHAIVVGVGCYCHVSFNSL